MIIVLCVIVLITLPFPIVMMYRNERTFRFRTQIVDMVFKDNNDDWEKRATIYQNGPSYNEMMYSFKPFKLESFYTPDEIKTLCE